MCRTDHSVNSWRRLCFANHDDDADDDDDDDDIEKNILKMAAVRHLEFSNFAILVM